MDLALKLPLAPIRCGDMWLGGKRYIRRQSKVHYLTINKNCVIIFIDKRKGENTLFNKIVDPSEEELIILLGILE